MSTPTRIPLLVACLASLGPSGAARADVFDEVERQIEPLKMRLIAERAAAAKEAARTHDRELKELDKAEKKVSEAHDRLVKIAEEALRAREKAELAMLRIADEDAAARSKAEKAAWQVGSRGQAKVDEAQRAFDARTAEQKVADARAAEAEEQARGEQSKLQAVVEAAAALDAAVAAVAAGKPEAAEGAAAKAKGADPLKLVADGVAGMAASLKKDDARAVALLSPEVLAVLPSARRYLALSKRRLGDKDGAWKELRAARPAPTDVEAQLAIAELATERKELDMARAAWAAAYATDPTNEAAGLSLSRTLLALGRPGDALAPLTALAADPTDKEAIYLLGATAERVGDERRAELAFAQLVGAAGEGFGAEPSYARRGRAIRVVPTHGPWSAAPDSLDAAAARTRFAWYRLRRGDGEGALRALAGVDSAEARYLRGLALLRAGRYGQARGELEEAAKRAPDRTEPRQAYGVALLDEGDAADAREVFSAVVNDPLALIGQAVADAQLGKRAEAEALLVKLVDARSSAADAAATDLAAIRREAGDLDGAVRAAPARPTTPEGWLLRGFLLGDKGDGAGAEAAFRAAVDQAPNFVDAWLALAVNLDGRGAPGAKEAAARTLEISPDSVEARAVLARAYGREGDRKREAEELAKIRELGEKVSGVAKKHAIAIVAFENNTGDKALDWMRQGIAEALVTDLSRLGSLRIIERTQVQKGFQEQKLQELGFAEPSKLGQVGKLIGADALLVGQFTKAGDQLRLDGRVVEVGTNQILKTGSATGKAGDVFAVERQLALDLVSEYAAVTSREKVDFFAAKKPSLESIETMSRIRMLTTEGKAREAKAAFEKLLAEDPEAAAKLKELQKSWSDVAATVAIVPLQNVSARAEEQWLGVGIAEALTTDLKKMGLFLVERGQVEKLMQERRLTEIFNAEQAVNLGKLVGASILLIGSYQVVGGDLRIDARLVDVTTAQVMQSYTVDGKKDDLFAAENKLVKEIAEALKVEPSKVEREALAQGKPSLDDFKRYIQASSRLAIRETAAKPVAVRSIAVAPVKQAAGGDDRQATHLLRAALDRYATVAVRDAASTEPADAKADALVLATETRLGDKTRVDVRAVFATGEVAASATALGLASDAPATHDLAAKNLLTGLGLRRVLSDEQAASPKPLYKKWWVWAIVAGVTGAAAITAGAIVGADQLHLPAANSSITAR